MEKRSQVDERSSFLGRDTCLRQHWRIQVVSTAAKIVESSHYLGWKRPLASLSPSINPPLSCVPLLLVGTSTSFSKGNFSRHKDINKYITYIIYCYYVFSIYLYIFFSSFFFFLNFHFFSFTAQRMQKKKIKGKKQKEMNLKIYFYLELGKGNSI